jgi:hypothetical protein
MKVSKSILRNIIKESIYKVLKENEPDEVEDYGRDDKIDVCSYADYRFNPETLEITDDGVAYVEFYSRDFPDAYETCISSQTYYQPAEYDTYIGDCGGDFEVWDYELPEEYDDDIIDLFIEQNKQRIIEDLTNNADTNI